MQEKITSLIEEIEKYAVQNQTDLEEFRIKYISKKSVVGELFNELKNVPNEEKKAFGQLVNQVKQTAQSKFKELIDSLETNSETSENNSLDLTLPPQNETGGALPLNTVKRQIIEIFQRIGFNVSEGPEIEDDWHNFTALNFPENHPAREMQDTFFIEKDPDILLRTHTSNVQVRLMNQGKPPFRSIMPGRVFRNEAISARRILK